ncbi:MAG: hypothetical protein JG777_1814 [Clostridia bacterium]|jgi:hypothetical protein|nr:hypothetical protein [Clostridia bacterium]
MEFLFSLGDAVGIIKVVSMYFTIGILQPLYIGIIFLIYIFYKRIINFEQNILIKSKSSLHELVFESVMYGILAGFIISLIINFAGIHIRIDNGSLMYLWIVVIILALMNVRYLCFSYAGGILALSNLIFGWPDIDVSGLLALIGLLHLTEAFLIWSHGYKNAVPVFVRHKNKVVGAFSIQKFWPIPITLLVLNIILKADMPADVVNINTPDWWPLMKQPDILENQAILFGILPVPAALGYSEVVITDQPKRKAKKSATYLSLYSIILIGLSIASSTFHYLKYIAALFAPIAHELLILYWIKKEKNGNAYFSVPEKGVRILDTVEDGPGAHMGILPGDIILRINNKEVMTDQGIDAILSDYPTFIWVDILRDESNTLTLEHKSYPDGIAGLGIITVPGDENVSNVLQTLENRSLLSRVIKKLK